MNFDESILVRQCDEVAQAVQQIRRAFRSSSRVKTSELMNCFWALQDHLHRLVATISDHPAEIPSLNQKYASLTSDVIDILGFTAKTSIGNLAAVRTSCQAIQELLFELQNLKYSSTAASA